MYKKYLILIVLLSVLCFAGFIKAQNTSTSAVIAQLMAQIESLLQQIAQLQKQEANRIDWCYDFDSNLGTASTNTTDIMNLHTALGKEGISYGSDDITKYGSGTAVAVAQFQKKYASEILYKFGLTNGTGYFGKSTREKLNKLYGCSSSNNENENENENEVSCTDSDGGKNYYVKGSVSISNSTGIAADYCENTTSLKESYCSNNQTAWTSYACPNGCENGACKEGAITSPSCSKDSDCGTSNYTGTPYCTGASISQKYVTYTCKNPGASNAYCASSTTAKLKQNCMYNCENGACTTSSSSQNNCADSDGFNYFSKGYVAVGDKKYEDFCEVGVIVEYSCKSGVMATDKISCPNGCENGACKPESTTSSINVLYPIGGETWEMGSATAPKKYKVMWNYGNLDKATPVYIIFISRSGGKTSFWTDVNLSAGEYTLSLGDKINLATGSYKISVKAGNYETITKDYVNVVNNYGSQKLEAFIPGEFLKMGQTYSFDWASSGYSDSEYYVKGYLVQPYANKKLLISSNSGLAVSTGKLSWNVPLVFSEDFGFVENSKVYSFEIVIYKKSDNSLVTSNRALSFFAIGKSEYCYDDDGGMNYYTQGRVTLKNSTKFIDLCDNSTTLKEVYCNPSCDSTTPTEKCYVMKSFTCPTGYICNNGACKKISCTDSDGGKNYSVNGTVSGFYYTGLEYNKSDVCGGLDFVNEYFCEGDVSNVEQHVCPENSTCKNGACVSNTTSYQFFSDGLAAISQKLKNLLGL